jgi:hypothetical protein
MKGVGNGNCMFALAEDLSDPYLRNNISMCAGAALADCNED